MGDSDDEYDRKRGRDKFRGERSGDRENERERWPERERPRPRNDYYNRSSRYSPPPMKRMRGDFEDRHHPMAHRFGGNAGGHMEYGGGGGGGGMYGGYDPYGALNPFGQGAPMVAPNPREQIPQVSDGLTQPPMMTLKQFLATQDDSISDEVAVAKYNEYKIEFRRSQLNEFFVTHKDEEWFKLKYHPELSLKRKEEQISYLMSRVDVFLELLGKGDIPKVNVDTCNTEQLIRLLDTVVIKLEGGNDDDLKVLDEKPAVIVPISVKPIEEKSKVEETTSVDKAVANDELKKTESKDEGKSEKRESKKRRRTHSDSSSNSSDSSDSESDSESEKNPKSPELKSPEKKESTENGDNENGDANGEEKPSEDVEMKSEDQVADEVEKKEEEPIETDIIKVDEVVVVPEDDEPKVQKLEEKHKTSSIFVRNLAPTVTKAEVEAICKKFDGFLRVAIADPAVERRWFRRGWITFKRDVNIKEICWNLNNIRLRDCELAPIVNRDLSRRVRPVNGITAHKTICKNDIKICAKIAHSLDEKYGLWKDRNDEVAEKSQAFGLQSKNPVLKNITDYLIEEADAEEEELLGLSSDNKDENDGEVVDRDSHLITVLDKIVLYLRIVHSVDYYNHCEYPYEDEMPNRCGIIHARGPQPQNKVTSTEVQDYMKNFESKISQFLTSSAEVPADELKKIGAKDIDAEVEKFITANSQELAKDKWLCPLSGKKFKGPDYIRKHIFNKHAEKVEEVKKEVEYFNNYLKDSKRPQIPEHPGNAPKKEAPSNPNMFRPHFAPMPYHSYGGYAPAMSHRGRGGFSRGGRMDMGHRPIINYRDLDAEKPDDFF